LHCVRNAGRVLRTPVPLLQFLLVKVGRPLQLLQLVIRELLGLSARSVSAPCPTGTNMRVLAQGGFIGRRGVQRHTLSHKRRPPSPAKPRHARRPSDPRNRLRTHRLPMTASQLSDCCCRRGQWLRTLAAPGGVAGGLLRRQGLRLAARLAGCVDGASLFSSRSLFVYVFASGGSFQERQVVEIREIRRSRRGIAGGRSAIWGGLWATERSSNGQGEAGQRPGAAGREFESDDCGSPRPTSNVGATARLARSLALYK
jgi:hypothetical protein